MALLDTAVVLVILLGCSALGSLVRPLLSERHTSREVIEFIQLVVAMLMTFVVLVLGLGFFLVAVGYAHACERL